MEDADDVIVVLSDDVMVVLSDDVSTAKVQVEDKRWGISNSGAPSE